MKVYLSAFLILLLGIFLLFESCRSSGKKTGRTQWAAVIQDMQIALISKAPDSVKYAGIKLIFEKNRINIDEYKLFYDRCLNSTPSKNRALLEEVEAGISAEMRQASDKFEAEGKKQMKDLKIQPREKAPKL